MGDPPAVLVVPHPMGALVICTVHGPVTVCDDPVFAAMDAMGHAAHHHPAAVPGA